MTSGDRNVLLFQALRILLTDVPYSPVVKDTIRGLTMAIEELTMEEE